MVLTNMSELLNHHWLATPYNQAFLGTVTALLLLGIARLLRIVYLTQFHPLAKFPGPRQASTSLHWLFQLSSKGHAEEEFERLHKLYRSDAIRIGPNELHLSDVTLYKKIYDSSDTYKKPTAFYQAFGDHRALFVERSTSLHKQLRGKVNPHFSQKKMFEIQSLITDSLTDLTAKLQDRDTHEPVNLYRFVRCFPPDVISKYVFGKSDVISRADAEFRNDIVEVLDLLVATIWDRAYHPWKTTITNYVPMGIAAAISGNVAKMIAFINLVNQRVQEFRAGQSKTKFPPVISSMTDQAEDSVQLAAMGLLAAGSDTTGYTIYAAARELIRDPLLRRHLVSELDTAFSHTESSFPDLATLQHLPLLTAIINETLRFYPAVEGRLPREVPKPTKDPLIIDGVLIPPGTIVGISARTMHRHPQIWGADDAETFRPARWLEDQNNNKESNERSKVKISPNNLVAFSKGSRNCVGQTLALAEIYIALAFLFQKFEFEYVSGPFEGVDEDLYMRTVRESISVRISLREEKR